MDGRFVFRPLVLWSVYLLILLWMVMPQGLDTPLVHFCDPAYTHERPCTDGILTPRSTNADLIRLFETADAGTIARHAKDYAERRDWMHVTGWPDWPPGMIGLQTFLYWFSPAMPVALVLVVLECVLWAAVLANLGLFLRLRGGDLLAFVLPLFLLLANEFTYYFHLGIFYTESLSTAAFLLGIGLLAQAVPGKKTKRAIVAGVFLALSAYMRAQTDLVMSVTLGLFLFCLLRCAWKLDRSFSLFAFRQAMRVSSWLAVLGVTLLTYQLATLPYRAQHGMQWTNMAGSAMWPPIWERKEDMAPELRFYTRGGGVQGCEADPQLCNFIHARKQAEGKDIFSTVDYFHFTLQSMLHHPGNWAGLKAPYLWFFWINTAQEIPWEFLMSVSQESILQTVLLVLLLVYCLRNPEGTHKLMALFLVSTMVGIIMPPLLSHFEARYLYQLKVMIFYVAILMMGNRPARNA